MLKNHRPQFAWLWLCFFAGLASAFAETTSPDFIINSWSEDEGLPESAIISVIQSKDGYLWLGTLNGLVRFDGNHFTVFNQFKTPGLSSDRVVFLFEDSRTNLWVGTESAGLDLIQNGTVKNFGTENAEEGGKSPVIYAYEDAESNVWFYDADGRFSSYQNGKMNYYAPNIFLPQLYLRAKRILVPAVANEFWQIEDGDIQKWKNNRLEKNYGPVPWNNTRVTSTGDDENGNLIVGTLGAGIFWFDADGKYQHLTKSEGLLSDYVLSMCLDSEGNLWVGTDNGGLNQIKRKIFNTPQIRPLPVQSFSPDTRDGLWMTFGASGATYWQNNSARDFQVGQFHDAWEILVDRQQNVWAGTRDDGLFLFQTNHFVPAPGADVLGAEIFALFEDRDGRLWVGSQNGLGCWNGQKWKLFTTRDGLSGNVVRAIAEDAGGHLWIGTENDGLDCFKDGKFTSFQKSKNGLPGNDIYSLYFDRDGALWIGTYGHGLARFQNGKWAHYSTDTGLASNSIGFIIEDDEGFLWIGSNMGLMRIQKKSLDDFADGTEKTLPVRVYTKADGLPTRECSIGAQPSAIRTRDGTLWFPTVKGVVSVNPKELKPDLRPPPVVIESVKVGGQEQKTNLLSSDWNQSVTIPPGGEPLEIHYTALNFSAPDAVRFKYRLEDHLGRPESGWTDAGADRVASFPKLPPGHYQFHVIACNEDGRWNEGGSVLEIVAQPYFWQTAEFRVAAIILILAIVAAGTRYFFTQKLQRQLQLLQQKEALERERSRIARDLHDQLGANLTQVALLGEMAGDDKHLPGEVESHAQQISQTARETTRALDEIVWAVNPSNDTLEGLVNYACKYAQDYFSLAGLRYRFDVPAQLPAAAIAPDVRHNVFLAFKEAVNNVVKHAQASEASVQLQLPPDCFILSIEDNGRGFNLDTTTAQTRNGLRNMRKRMEDIRGEFSISARTKGGTLVRLKVPLTRPPV